MPGGVGEQLLILDKGSVCVEAAGVSPAGEGASSSWEGRVACPAADRLVSRSGPHRADAVPWGLGLTLGVRTVETKRSSLLSFADPPAPRQRQAPRHPTPPRPSCSVGH